MKPTAENLVKTALAALLLICLFQLPFGYDQLARFVAVVGFAILAYYEYERHNIPYVMVLAGLMVLFQPLAIVPLGRPVWNLVDVVVAAGLVASMFVKNKNRIV